MNLLPSISAFCLERIEQLRRLEPSSPGWQAQLPCIQELQTVVDYCETLNRQAQLMEGCLNQAFRGALQPRIETNQQEIKS